MSNEILFLTDTGSVPGVPIYKAFSNITTSDSIVWTERYRTAGDFKFEFTKDARNTWYRFPRYQLVTLPDTLEVGIVEDRLLDTDINGNEHLTVTGRTLETFYEGRVARPLVPGTDPDSSFPNQIWPLNTDGGANKDKPNNWSFKEDAAEITRKLMNYWTTSPQSKIYSLRVPSYQVIKEVPTLKDRSITIQPGSVYARALELLAMDDLGVRNERPISGEGNTPLMTTVIYAGRNRASTVIFDESAGHLSTANYGDSVKGSFSRNWNFGYSSVTFTDGKGAAFKQRTGYNEASDVRVDSGAGVDKYDVKEALDSRGDKFHNDNLPTFLLSCSLSGTAPYRYGVHYQLGDLVTVQGSLGRTKKVMRVKEYIRIRDHSGDSSYPSLVDPASEDDNA